MRWGVVGQGVAFWSGVVRCAMVRWDVVGQGEAVCCDEIWSRAGWGAVGRGGVEVPDSHIVVTYVHFLSWQPLKLDAFQIA